MDGDAIVIDQFIRSKAHIALKDRSIGIDMDTDYPWNGDVRLRFTGFDGVCRVKLRVPGWCGSTVLRLNGLDADLLGDGYIDVEVRAGDLLDNRAPGAMVVWMKDVG